MKAIISCCALLTVALVFAAVSHPARSFAVPQDTTTHVRELQEERRDVLKRLVETMSAQYATGDADFSSLIAAQISLWDAELELAETAARRIEIHGERVAAAKQFERLAERRFELGVLPVDQVLLAKAARLQAEIEMAQAEEVQ